MSPTLGLVANIYNESNALPGWIETHIGFFDDVRVYHAGPQGVRSDDGTMEILAKWGIPYEMGAIDEGFGTVRTKAVRSSPCDYVMILDADERFYPVHYILQCDGESTPHSEVDAILQTYDHRDLKTMIPNWENIARLGANLRVHVSQPHYQGERLRELLDMEQPDAVIAVRRHWHDFSWKCPTQNWYTDPDWQMRIVRNHPSVYFDPNTRMHERLIGANNTVRSSTMCGPFFDHFHFTFKHMEPTQRSHDVATYDAIHAGKVPPTFEEFNAKAN